MPATDRTEGSRVGRWQRGPLRIGAAALVLLLAGVLVLVNWYLPDNRERARARLDDTQAERALKAGNESAAETLWLAAIAEWPGDADAYSNLGDFYQRHGETEVANVAYLHILRISPHYPHVYCRLAESSRDFGSDRDAAGYAKLELKRDPNCVRALDLLCGIDRHSGNLKAAQTEGARAYRVAPRQEESVCRYAETLMDSEPDQAIKVLTSALPYLRRSYQVAFDLGWCYSHSASTPEAERLAVAELRRAAALVPSAKGVHTELCRFLLERGRTAEAISEGRLAVTYDRFDPQAFFHYGQALQRAGKVVEAKAVMAQFQALDSAQSRQTTLDRRYGTHPGDPKMAHELAGLDIKLGKVRDAVLVMEIARDAHPADPMVLKDFARLMKMGANP